MTFDAVTGPSGPRTGLKRAVARGFAHTFATGAAEFMLRLGFTAVLARLITPEEFGIVMLVTAVTAVADNFRDLGLSTATIQRETLTHQEVSNLFWINASAGALIAGALSSVAPLLSLYFREPRLTAVTIALASTFAMGGLSVQHEALLTRQLKLGPKAAMRLAAFALSSVIAVALALNGYGYWALVWRDVLRSAFIVVGAWQLCRWVPSRFDRQTKVRRLLAFGSGLTATYVLHTIAGSLDRILLGRVQSPSAVGLYRQAYQLVAAPMSQLMGPLHLVSLPGLSRLQGDPQRFGAAFRQITVVVAMASMPLAVSVAILAHEITTVMLGPRWAGSELYIRIFAIGSIVQSLSSTLWFVLVSRGHSSELVRLTALQTAWRVTLMTAGSHWGGVGIAVADSASTLLAFVPSMRRAFRNSPVSPAMYLEAISRPLAASAAVAAALVLIKSAIPLGTPVLTLGLSGLAAVAIFPSSIALMPGGREELRQLYSLATTALRARRGQP